MPYKNKKQKVIFSPLNRRVLLLGVAQLGVVGAIGWKMHRLSIQQGEQYRLLAEENRINIRLLPPPRGLIYDRIGNPLTINRQVYTIEIIREQAIFPQDILYRLSQLIPLTSHQIEKTLQEISQHRSFVPVTVATGVEWKHIAKVLVNMPVLPGIVVQLDLSRQYPHKGDFCHIVGYVGAVSSSDLKNAKKAHSRDPLLRLPRFKIGKTGIEAVLDRLLRGQAGVKRIEVNAVGRVIRELDNNPSKAGDNVQLTIQGDLQKYAAAALGDNSAAAVVMDVNNGDILTMVSSPTFDPNIFLKSFSQDVWNKLNNPRYRPLINKAVAGTYPPGSTFKMMVALSALNARVVINHESIYCDGALKINRHKFHCWRRYGHGAVDLVRALRESCDVYFYNIARRVGIEKITATARQFGLGEAPDIALLSIKAGLLPTKDWKKRIKQENWHPGDTVNAAIGQGFVLASPLQLAIMTARIASGTNVKPHLLYNRDSVQGHGQPLNFDVKHLALLRQGMFEVVNHSRGTARKSQLDFPDVAFAGKTGTSQVRRITAEERALGVIKNQDLPWNRRDHALFVGFAPYKKPRYAIAVVVEHGGGGSKVAAPIARDIMLKTLQLGTQDYGIISNERGTRT